ncbi:hypothetical protein FQA47_018265 [Oryzias melastigma]|uniref:Uncharacterized protein n=1 Tax=Oryzias melastigma TaxID=30732 RepID=A0A834FRZ5_ORYME|nr:hypothetical protein FQA47_018265 [Oryzias melastigma]
MTAAGRPDSPGQVTCSRSIWTTSRTVSASPRPTRLTPPFNLRLKQKQEVTSRGDQRGNSSRFTCTLAERPSAEQSLEVGMKREHPRIPAFSVGLMINQLQVRLNKQNFERRTRSSAALRTNIKVQDRADEGSSPLRLRLLSVASCGPAEPLSLCGKVLLKSSSDTQLELLEQVELSFSSSLCCPLQAGTQTAADCPSSRFRAEERDGGLDVLEEISVNLVGGAVSLNPMETDQSRAQNPEGAGLWKEVKTSNLEAS